MDKREEILNNHKSIKFDGKYGITGRMFYHESVIEAMSEYAQLESIEFAEWIKKEKIEINIWNGLWTSRKICNIKQHGMNASELYQIFKQEQQTTK